MRPARNRIPQRRARHDHGHLLAVEELDDRGADRRLVVVLRQAAAGLAHVGDAPFQALVRAYDPDVIPHRGLDRRPVLKDQRGIFHVLAAWWPPVRDREQEGVGWRSAPWW